MKILLLHSDFIEWEPKKKAIKDAEEIEKRKYRAEETLVVFSSVEKDDEGKEKEVIEKAAAEIVNVYDQVKATSVVVYPYVHLSTTPSKPGTALKILKGVEKNLKGKKLKVYRAPFGWYKSFQVKCKGHPLAELSREISSGEGSNDSMEARMETASHLVFDTTRKITGQKYISISETSDHKSVLHWKHLKFDINNELIEKIQKEVNKNLASNLEVKIEDLNRSEAMERCGKIFEKAVPKKLKKLRVVSIGNLPPEPCGNPHVSSTDKIAKKINIVGYKKIGDGEVDITISIPKEKGDSEDVSEAVKKEEALKSEWYVLDTDGKLNKVKIEKGKVKGFDFSKHKKLEKFALYEMAKSRVAKEEPPHVKLMRRLELVDYEGGSDPGHFRYMPAGKLVKSLLEEFVTKKVVEYGAMEVETPLMYDYEHPSLKKYLDRFPARQYTIETPNKKVFLRFSACFGQFLMSHDANISYRNLPFRIYEMTRYSFRVEQRGELAGLRRLRAFTMPDCHAFCRDVEEAKKELMVRLEMSKNLLSEAGVPIKDDLEVGVRVVRDFYERNRDFLKRFVKKIGKPVLLEMWDKQFFYFVFKYETNFVDALDKAAALSTDQIDVENAERYGIQYMDRDNKKKYPIILHLSPSGAIERVIYALLEKAYLNQKEGKNPMLPLWLSPTQVRLCPLNENFNGYCDELAERLGKENIRTDVDDRVESVGKKVRDSEVQWVPYTIVIGEREKGSGKFPVRFREDGKVRKMSFDQIVKEIRKRTEGMPWKPLSLDRHLTKRPIFIG